MCVSWNQTHDLDQLILKLTKVMETKMLKISSDVSEFWKKHFPGLDQKNWIFIFNKQTHLSKTNHLNSLCVK